MERGKTTGFILRQFKKKSKRALSQELYSEFFYFNKSRKVVEFLSLGDSLLLENFFKEFLPREFKDFVSLVILNEHEEKIQTWYYDDEELVLILKVNWGLKKQEISIDINIENYIVTSINDNGTLLREVDYILLNDFLISFLTIQARNLAKTFEKLSKSD